MNQKPPIGVAYWLVRAFIFLAVAATITMEFGFFWGGLFVVVDVAYTWWRFAGPTKEKDGEQKKSKSSWSRTLR
jgi:hypothetical protein